MAEHVTAGSRQVNWWSVHEWVSPVLSAAGSWPVVGTPEWRALPDNDARKIAAVYDAAQHWALRVDTVQQNHAEASRVIAAAAPWSEIARRQQSEADFYAARPWLKRVSA